MKDLGLYMILPYLGLIFWLGLFLLIFKIGLNYLKNKGKIQIKNIDKSTYYRDIPCFANIDIAYWLLYNFSNIKKNDLNNGLIGAYLLDWYKKGYIDIEKSQDIGLKNGNYNIDLKDGNWNKNFVEDKIYVENKIYNFLKTVAGNNNLLQKNEIKNYCSLDENRFELKFLFQNILTEIQDYLEKRKYITVIPAKNYILFKTQEKIILSDELINEYQKLNGLKNFLLDYSNMEEKKHIEVHIWENYLIFANLLGIADKVKQQFNKIYPSFNAVNSMFDVSFDNTIVGQLNTVYKGFKWQFYTLVGSVLLVAVIIFGSGNFTKPILKILPFAIITGMLYWLLRKYLINKKVKEMDTTTYAKITKVNVHYHTERDLEMNRDITTKSYSFTYEYCVNGVYYTGQGHSNFKKRERQKIKIYYNEMKPQESETAQKHNYYLKIFIFIIAILIILFWLLNKTN